MKIPTGCPNRMENHLTNIVNEYYERVEDEDLILRGNSVDDASTIPAMETLLSMYWWTKQEMDDLNNILQATKGQIREQMKSNGVTSGIFPTPTATFKVTVSTTTRETVTAKGKAQLKEWIMIEQYEEWAEEYIKPTTSESMRITEQKSIFTKEEKQKLKEGKKL